MTQPADIVMDATPLLFPHGGVGRVTGALLTAMEPLLGDLRLSLYARSLRGVSIQELRPSLPGRRLRLPQQMEGLIARFGVVERLCPARLYHATDHVLPLRQPERAIATVHDLIFLLRPEAHMPIHLRQAAVAPDFIRRAKHLIACSQSTKRDLIEHLQIDPARIDVIYWGIDASLFNTADDPDAVRAQLAAELQLERPFFFAINCSTGRKNTPRVLAAYRKLLADSPEHDLVLAWSPPPEIQAEYAAEVAAGRIHFIGKVSDARLQQLYQACAAVVYPSLYEGFGLPVLEAFACGALVLTSDNSSLPEVGGDAAIYVDPEDTDSIRDGLARIESGLPDRDERLAAGASQVAKFSWYRCAQETLAVYRRCLDDTPRRIS